jgi:hypothetical protein
LPGKHLAHRRKEFTGKQDVFDSLKTRSLEGYVERRRNPHQQKGQSLPALISFRQTEKSLTDVTESP